MRNPHLFARSDLRKGDVIVVWGGRVFTRNEIDAGKAKDHTMVAVDEGLFLGSAPTDEYTPDDFMNHSCSANIGMQDAVTLVSRCDIAAGVELTSDYAVWLDNPGYVMKRKCNCLAEACRMFVTGRDWMSGAVQASNRGHFSPFLQRRIVAMSLSGSATMNIIVTGGSRGIGNAIAHELVGAGHRVLIVGRTKGTLEESRAVLARGARESPLACDADVSKSADRERLVQFCEDSGFCPQVLVLNAGIFLEGGLLTGSAENYSNTMSVNVDSAFHLVQAFAPRLTTNGSGRIILIGSTAAYEPYPLGAFYGVSKWALRGFATNLRRELMHKDIGVTFVAPGGTLTDLWAGEELPPNRLMRPSDIGRLVRATLELSPQAVVEEIVVRPMLGDIHE